MTGIKEFSRSFVRAEPVIFIPCPSDTEFFCTKVQIYSAISLLFTIQNRHGRN